MALKTLYSYCLFSFLLCFCLSVKTTLEAQSLADSNIKRELLIESDTASFDQKAGLVILQDNVLLIFSDIEFKSDKMTLLYEDRKDNPDKSLSQIKEISAMGNVIVQHNEQIISSSLARFFPTENKVNLMGNVKVVSGKKAGITADKMSIDLNSGKTNFIGKVSSSITLRTKD